MTRPTLPSILYYYTSDHDHYCEGERPSFHKQTGRASQLETLKPHCEHKFLDMRQKRSYLHHQGEFQHNYFDFVSLHDSDHDGVVRIIVGHSEVVERLLFRLYYITRHNFSPTRSVIY